MPDVTRADAQRNRERILEVASEAFADDPGVSLNQVAKRSGVGPGTLYRHFPTREALLLAVYAHEIDGLADAVEQSLATQSPLDAFRHWVRRLAAYVRLKHGLGDALTTSAARAVLDSTYAPVTGAIQRFLDAAVESGDARADVRASDVLLMLGALWRVPDTTEGLEQADRLLELVVASLR